MFKVHVFEVGLGDSLVIETNDGADSYYSIVDCKKVGNVAPTVEFLRKNGIVNIQSVFLTHYHRDHYSGFPLLLEYLQSVKGTLEYLICPQTTTNIEFLTKLIHHTHDEVENENLSKFLQSFSELSKLKSLSHYENKTMSIQLLFEGSCNWRTDIHKGLSIAPINPSSQHCDNLMKQALEKNDKYNTGVNAISHAFLIKHTYDEKISYALFTGDLEGKTWRTVANTCDRFTMKDPIGDNLKFFKVPHHGSKNFLK